MLNLYTRFVSHSQYDVTHSLLYMLCPFGDKFQFVNCFFFLTQRFKGAEIKPVSVYEDGCLEGKKGRQLPVEGERQDVIEDYCENIVDS